MKFVPSILVSMLATMAVPVMAQVATSMTPPSAAALAAFQAQVSQRLTPQEQIDQNVQLRETFKSQPVLAMNMAEIYAVQNGIAGVLGHSATHNRFPSPKQVLEYSLAMNLTAETIAKLNAIEAERLAKAQAVGQKLLAAEAAVDSLFARDGIPSQRELKRVIDAASEARGELREVHLQAHIQVRQALTAAEHAQFEKLAFGKALTN